MAKKTPGDKEKGFEASLPGQEFSIRREARLANLKLQIHGAVAGLWRQGIEKMTFDNETVDNLRLKAQELEESNRDEFQEELLDWADNHSDKSLRPFLRQLVINIFYFSVSGMED